MSGIPCDSDCKNSEVHSKKNKVKQSDRYHKGTGFSDEKKNFQDGDSDISGWYEEYADPGRML